MASDDWRTAYNELYGYGEPGSLPDGFDPSSAVLQYRLTPNKHQYGNDYRMVYTVGGRDYSPEEFKTLSAQYQEQNDPAKELKSLLDKANAENEARYQELLSIADQRIGLADAFGQTARTRIDRSEAAQVGDMTQSLIDRGLYNTTVPMALERGIRSESEFQRQGVDEAEARLRSDLMADKMGVIERKSDVAPDLALYSQLQKEASAGSGGAYPFVRLGGSKSQKQPQVPQLQRQPPGGVGQLPGQLPTPKVGGGAGDGGAGGIEGGVLGGGTLGGADAIDFNDLGSTPGSLNNIAGDSLFNTGPGTISPEPAAPDIDKQYSDFAKSLGQEVPSNYFSGGTGGTPGSTGSTGTAGTGSLLPSQHESNQAQIKYYQDIIAKDGGGRYGAEWGQAELAKLQKRLAEMDARAGA